MCLDVSSPILDTILLQEYIAKITRESNALRSAINSYEKAFLKFLNNKYCITIPGGLF